MSEMLSQMFSEVPLVDKATADEDTPTPGYIYNEIIRAYHKYTLPEVYESNQMIWIKSLEIKYRLTFAHVQS